MNPRSRYESDDIAWLKKPDADVESTWIERKEWTDAAGLSKQISGFANGQPPGGLIVLGASSDGRIVGVEGKAPDRLLAEFPSRVEGQGDRDWMIRSPSGDGHRLLFIYVPFSENRVLCLSNGTAFKRVGNTTIELTPDQVIELRDARGEKPFEGTPVADFSEEILDSEIAKAFLAGVVGKNGLSLPLTLLEALENKRLVARSPSGLRLTVAGVLVLATRPTDWIPGARLRFLRFEGTVEKTGAERNVIRDQFFDGPIPRLIERVREFMGTQVREFDYLGASGVFVREPEYPPDVWLEAITNALVHRSYNLQTATVFVRMFDDRLEVESPGGFPKGNRPDPDGIIPLHLPRNRELAQALDYLGLVRLAREGTRRMHDEMLRMNLPLPEFNDDRGNKVVVILRNDIERRRMRSGVDVGKEWSEVEALLSAEYEILRKRGLQKWRMLSLQQASPPSSLVQSAMQRLRQANTERDPEEKRALLDLLSQLPDDILRQPVLNFVQQTLPYGLNVGRSDLSQQVAFVVSRFDPAVESVLTFLETRGAELFQNGLLDKEIPANLLGVLQARLNREPFPTKDWLDRAVAVARRYRLPEAEALFRTITGRTLT